MENRAQFISDYLATNGARMGATQKVPVVHAIAIGPDANRSQMQNLAQRTGGTYLYLADPRGTALAAPLSAQAGPPPALDVANDLAEFYRIIAETLEAQQQIFSARGTWANLTTGRHQIYVDRGVTEAVFSANWHGLEGPGSVTLRSPGGATIAPSVSEGTHQLFRVPSPSDGLWTLTVAGCSASAEFCAGNYLVEAAVKSTLTMHLYLTRALSNRVIGADMPILAQITGTGPVTGATVTATVLVPEYEGALRVEPAETRTLRLYDDGQHGDGGANDGIYGNLFRRVDRPGSYDVLVVGSGNAPVHGGFCPPGSGGF